MNKFDQLPSELLWLILERVDPMHLCTCSFINKRFHSQTIPLLWRRLDIDSETALTKFTSIITTSPHSPGAHIRFLRLTFRLSGTALLALVQHTPFLEHLTLTEATSITDTSFKHVPRHCAHLQSLSIYRGDITLLSMVALGKHCQHLGVLRLKLCPYLDYAPLFFALRACPLTVIDITPCDMYRKESRHVSEAMAWSLYRDHQRLTSLTIQNADNDYTTFLTTANDHRLTWSHLTHVCFDACHSMDDSMAITFLQAHPHLVTLELNGTAITDPTLETMAKCLPNVTKICVRNNPRITGKGIWQLVNKCNNLDNGVWFSGCGIYLEDDAFPKDLDSWAYRLEDVDEHPEMIWMARQCD